MSNHNIIPVIEKFSIKETGETEGEYTIYDIDTNLDVKDGNDAAHIICDDLSFDSRVARMLVSIHNSDIVLLNGVEVDVEQLVNNLAVANTKVELTTKPSRQKISDAWIDDLEYKGVNVYQAIYNDVSNQEKLDRAVQELYSVLGVNERDFSVQECYLGYSPSKDQFVMGYDGWYTEISQDEEEEDTDGSCSPYIVFSLTNRVVDIKKSDISDYVNTWYSGGWDKVKVDFNDLLDVRLD